MDTKHRFLKTPIQVDPDFDFCKERLPPTLAFVGAIQMFRNAVVELELEELDAVIVANWASGLGIDLTQTAEPNEVKVTSNKEIYRIKKPDVDLPNDLSSFYRTALIEE